MADSYDVLVIGAGPGGYPAAIRAAQLGLRTACVEKEKLGGVCLNWGCIPSKALLKTAEFALQTREASTWGIEIPEVDIDYPKVIARSRKVSKRFERGVAGLFKKYGVTSLSGTATITGPGEVEIADGDDAGTVRAEHVIIATGGRARVFPGMEPDGERIWTYREAIVATERPERVTVIGAGAIGMEFAYFWNAMDAEVTVVEAMPEVLPLEDAECAAAARKAMAKQGIEFVLGQKVKAVDRDGDEVVTTLDDDTTIRSSHALIALGVSPNVEGIGLDSVGIELDETGAIQVDASYRTNVEGFYALGDVCSLGPALAHTATRQAHVCVDRIAGHQVPDVDYTAMPSCTYCQPQVASVGFTEQAAREAGYDVLIGRFPFLANGKAQGAEHGEGFVKVIIDQQYKEVLGAHIVGAEATEMIAEFVLARSSETPADVIQHTTHAHPTFSEAMYEAVNQAFGESVHI